MYQSLRTNELPDDYVVFDIETSGLNPKKDKIIEIGAIKYKDNKKIDEFSYLIDPEIKLNQIEVTEIVMDRIVEILNLARKQILLLTKQDISYIVITGGLTEIRAFKNLVYEIFGKDVIIYTEDTLGVRNNKYTTAVGMIKYFADKMETRGKEYSMVDREDEELLINPNNKNKKDRTKITKIFGSFIGTKED